MPGDAPDGGGADDAADDDADDTTTFDPTVELHRQLAATEERPVEREAGWHLGEAQALAADVAEGDLDEPVVRERAAEIRGLLDEFETTGDPEADDRVDAARELADRVARQ